VMVMMKFANTTHFDQIPFCPYAVFCSYIKSCTCYYVARFSFSNFIISKYLGKKKNSKKKIIMENENSKFLSIFCQKKRNPKNIY
jgi:hypothetical protein